MGLGVVLVDVDVDVYMHAYAYVYVYVYVYVCVYGNHGSIQWHPGFGSGTESGALYANVWFNVCERVCVCVHVRVKGGVSACMYVWGFGTCVRVYVRTCVRVFVRTCVCAYVSLFVRVYVRTSVRARVCSPPLTMRVYLGV